MFNEIIIVLLGLFVGVYASLIGGVAGSALMMYIFLHYDIIKPYDKLNGTIIFISCIPFALVGLYEYYKHKSIDFYSGLILIIALSIGMFFGSKYNFVLNDMFGVKAMTNFKYIFSSVMFALLSILYFYEYKQNNLKNTSNKKTIKK